MLRIAIQKSGRLSDDSITEDKRESAADAAINDFKMFMDKLWLKFFYKIPKIIFDFFK